MNAVHLARIGPGDQAEFLAAVARSAKLHRPWVAAPATPEAFSSLVKRSRDPVNACFLLRHSQTGALVGVFNISNIVRAGFQSAYLGYYVFAGHERQGLMRQGMQLLVRTAFRELKLHRLEANIQPGNAASIALERSCGFQQEGYSPRYLKIQGRWRDHERWAILAR